MADDRALARRALAFERNAREYRLLDVPGYMAWSQRKLREGEDGTLIAHLDATTVTSLPEELGDYTEASFEEMLDDLRITTGSDDTA